MNILLRLDIDMDVGQEGRMDIKKTNLVASMKFGRMIVEDCQGNAVKRKERDTKVGFAGFTQNFILLNLFKSHNPLD